LEHTDEEGRTPLFYAAANNDFEMVAFLVNTGQARCDVIDYSGRTIVHYMLQELDPKQKTATPEIKKTEQILRLFLEEKRVPLDLGEREREKPLPDTMNPGSMLDVAIRHHLWEVQSFLVTHGAYQELRGISVSEPDSKSDDMTNSKRIETQAALKRVDELLACYGVLREVYDISIELEKPPLMDAKKPPPTVLDAKKPPFPPPPTARKKEKKPSKYQHHTMTQLILKCHGFVDETDRNEEQKKRSGYYYGNNRKKRKGLAWGADRDLDDEISITDAGICTLLFALPLFGFYCATDIALLIVNGQNDCGDTLAQSKHFSFSLHEFIVIGTVTHIVVIGLWCFCGGGAAGLTERGRDNFAINNGFKYFFGCIVFSFWSWVFSWMVLGFLAWKEMNGDKQCKDVMLAWNILRVLECVATPFLAFMWWGFMWVRALDDD